MTYKTPARFTRLHELREKIGLNIPAIDSAITATDEKLESLAGMLLPKNQRSIAEDASVVFFGSLARGECTSKSDLDWIVLVDGQVDEQHFRAYHDIRDTLLAAKEIPPGSSGIFGGLGFSHDIVHRIGGNDDSNRNLTLRMLLLLESVSIGDDSARKRVIRAILRRYLADDPSWTWKSDGKVPRFFLNDCVRFWRTMAVDFADKYHDQAGEKWALRNAKLRFSRRLIFLASIFACFSWHLQPRKNLSENSVDAVDIAQLHFAQYFSRPPLEIVADELLLQSVPEQISKELISSYNEFLAILDDEGSRRELSELPRDLAEKSMLFQQVRKISHRFRDAAIAWLFDIDPKLFTLVRDYGIF